jgi:protein SCO1/2
VRVAILLVVLTLVACAPRADGDVRRYQLRGTVASHDPSSSRVVVSHKAVTGLMPAMTMPFEITGAAPVMREGDRIIATLVVTASRSWLEDVRITPAGGVAGERPVSGARAAPGAIVPAFPLLDQDNRPLTLDAFAGRVLIVTFIYTRCPLPDFCPLMVRHLERVRHRAKEEGIGGRLAWLGVTLDPEFDTPAVLRTYGESVLKGPGRFDQWTLAGGTAGCTVRRFWRGRTSWSRSPSTGAAAGGAASIRRRIWHALWGSRCGRCCAAAGARSRRPTCRPASAT